MHYFQQRYLEQNRAFVGTTGLDIIELPNKGLLSGIKLQIYATAGTTKGDRDVSVIDCLKKVEVIVNGSQVVKSLTGREIKAMMYYQKMAMAQDCMWNKKDGVSRVELFINFGRHHHDLEYMLDLGQVNDPELRIEYDFTITSHDGWTNGEAHTLPHRDVICHILRDPNVVPKGYIKTSELSRFLWVSGRIENMTVPRGPTYSNLYVESYYKSSGLTFTLDNIEVNINSDDIVPLHLDMQEFIDDIEAMWGRFLAHEIKDVDFVNLIPSIMEAGAHNVNAHGAGVALIFDNAALWGQNLGIGVYDDAGAPDPGANYIQIDYSGILPYSVAAIPLFDPWDPDTWIDTSVLGDFWVRYACTAVGNALCPIKLLGDEVVTRYTTPSWP